MTSWHCDSFCKISQGGAGPWDDDDSEFFVKIKSAHFKCIGFQKGERKLKGKSNWENTEIEKEFTYYMIKNYDEMLYDVITSYRLDKVCLIIDKWKG